VTAPTWSPADVPDLTGRSAVVTGANSGIGFTTALGLARAGMQVVMTSRDAARGQAALMRARQLCPGAEIELRSLDLADLASVRAFVGTVDNLDLLVNNAGVMATPHRRTADGFELQLGTNHLGHFALTGLLMPALLHGSEGPRAADDRARVVTVTSGLHRTGRLRRDDLMHEGGYRRWSAYGQSKLANMLFTLELQRRAAAAGAPLLSLAAHPGYAATNLQAVGPRMDGRAWVERLTDLAGRVFAQSAEAGAWPTLRAATDPGAPPGALFGPGGLGGMRGAPVLETPSAQARSAEDAAWLWERSAELTGVPFAF
jgi:NAD(P)-dependent dehydrogenase (short-subunit alcohol dehydrogenase family)